MTKLNSHNEWDRLKEVIVGTAQNTSAVLTWKKKQKLDNKIILKAKLFCKKKSCRIFKFTWFFGMKPITGIF